MLASLRLSLAAVPCSEEALCSLRVPPPTRSRAASRRRWIAAAGAAAAVSAVPSLASRLSGPIPYRSFRTARTRDACQLHAHAYERRRAGSCTRATLGRTCPRCDTTGPRRAVAAGLHVAGPGAGRGGAGALDRPARRHPLEDRALGLRRKQPCRGSGARLTLPLPLTLTRILNLRRSPSPSLALIDLHGACGCATYHPDLNPSPSPSPSPTVALTLALALALALTLSLALTLVL